MRPLLLRTLTPLLVVVAWLAVGGVGGPYFGRISEVAENNQEAFLPLTAEATVVGEKYREFVGDDQIPAFVVIHDDEALTPQTLQEISTAATALSDVDGVVSVSPPIPAEDGLAVQVFVGVGQDADVSDSLDLLRTALREQLPATVDFDIAGPAALSSDLAAAFSGIDGLLLAVTLAVVLVILVLVYRAVILPLVVLLTSVFALATALLANWWLARWGVLTITGQTQGILFILVIGAATDYSLLYTARYYEELGRRPDGLAATKAAWLGTVEPILASGGTVIAGLLCLLLSDLGSNRSLGPVAAIGIAFAMLASLTLLPAFGLLLGRIAYWPRAPRRADDGAEEESGTGGYARIGTWIAARPRKVWISCIAVLALGAAFAPTLKAQGVPVSEFVLGASQAREGQQRLAQHFPGGSGSPAYVSTTEGDLQEVADLLLANPGIDSVSVLSADSPSGSVPVTSEGIQPLGPPGTPAPPPTVRDGEVMLLATLTDIPDSDAALETISGLRADLAGRAQVGGASAVDLDTRTTSQRDRVVIIPLVLGVILAILILLLRCVLAPVLLVATTALSFGTALGVSALVFNHLLDLPGADPSVPLFGFVFLVALGIDYNIFLMTRVREEALAHGTREGILRGLSVTGGVITSAGLVLAATFAALAVLPILFLLQIAFIVAFGVLLDTFLVRTLLVPALGLDIGRTIWWPSQLGRAER
ncbi:MMPL family transporter [Arachnia propionica]|uniref:MMPL family transporter n=1 Tax=Arachnia propionica TaxID=1750 RepID=A0A3P1T213_9ACTN|nr:MMPL family transporter [Arachnia propionica]RRD03502.1 MMPL family transporter [Arachnia propionica]